MEAQGCLLSRWGTSKWTYPMTAMNSLFRSATSLFKESCGPIVDDVCPYIPRQGQSTSKLNHDFFQLDYTNLDCFSQGGLPIQEFGLLLARGWMILRWLASQVHPSLLTALIATDILWCHSCSNGWREIWRKMARDDLKMVLKWCYNGRARERKAQGP